MKSHTKYDLILTFDLDLENFTQGQTFLNID